MEYWHIRLSRDYSQFKLHEKASVSDFWCHRAYSASDFGIVQQNELLEELCFYARLLELPDSLQVRFANHRDIDSACASFHVDSNGNVVNPVILLNPGLFQNCRANFVDVATGVFLHECGHVLFSRGLPSCNREGSNPRIDFYINLIEDARIEDLILDSSPGFFSYLFAAREQLLIKEWFLPTIQRWGELCDTDKINLIASIYIRTPNLLIDGPPFLRAFRDLEGRNIFKWMAERMPLRLSEHQVSRLAHEIVDLTNQYANRGISFLSQRPLEQVSMEERNRLRHQIDCDAIDFFRQKERDEKKCEVSKLRIPLRPGVIEELSDALKRQNVVLSTDLSIYWPSDDHIKELVVTKGVVETQVASTETLSIQLPETIKKSKIVMEKLKGRSGSLVAYQEASNRVREHVNRLKAQFRRNTRPSKTLCRQANGRLDPKQLYRSSYDPCIFKKQAPGRPDQVLVVLLLDGSGSMIEKNAYKRALETAVMFKEGFEGSKDIDVRVYGHTSDEEQEICVVSDFGIGAEAKASLAQYFPGMSNFDYLAIYATASKMGRHPASRKILVSISDGLPCAPTRGPCINAVKATADAVQDIRQKGWTVFGVEIGKHSGNMIYGPEWNLSVSAESLPSSMGLLITNLLRRARL